MGLFSKPSEAKVVEMFNSLTDTEKESVKNTLFGATKVVDEQKAVEDTAAVDETAKDTTDEVVDAVDNSTANVDKSADNVDKSNENVDNKPQESYEEMFKRLMEENRKELENLKEQVQKQFEELSNKQPETNTEKKPFGLTENAKEYKANSKPKETSSEYIKRLFGNRN